jgi:hypothetical protein
MVNIASTKMMKKFFAAREFARPCRYGVQRFHDVTNLEGGGPDFPRHCERNEAIHRPQAKAGLLRR